MAPLEGYYTEVWLITKKKKKILSRDIYWGNFLEMQFLGRSPSLQGDGKVMMCGREDYFYQRNIHGLINFITYGLLTCI